MTSTDFSIGFGDTNRLSSKVLKPPGGGSSDIFGNTTIQSEMRRRQQESNIFGGDCPVVDGTTPRKSADTKNRLFGPPEQVESPKKSVDRMKSNIFNEEKGAKAGSGKKYVHRNPITGEMVEIGPKENGNANINGNINLDPITGEGVSAESPAPSCVRIKNPPGGKSSGIF